MRPLIPALLLLLCAAPAPVKAEQAKDPKIERLWRAKCASCHGDDGKGQTVQGKKMDIRDLASAAVQKDLTDDKVRDTILNGVKEEKGGKKKEMDAFKDKLRPEQLQGLITYVRGLAK